MRLDPDGNIWTTDVNAHIVRKMNLDGEVLLTIGTQGQAGDASAGLLNEPTDLTINAAGEIFILVGHGRGEPRLLKFDRTGTLMTSWGGPGTAPGKFDTPAFDRGRSGRAPLRCRPAESTCPDLRRRRDIHQGVGIQGSAMRAPHCSRPADLPGERLRRGDLRLDSNGKAIGAIGQPGKGLGEFGEAHYMTMAPNGDIFVADTVRPGLQKFVRK